jgi:hypothetical protein
LSRYQDNSFGTERILFGCGKKPVLVPGPVCLQPPSDVFVGRIVFRPANTSSVGFSARFVQHIWPVPLAGPARKRPSVKKSWYQDFFLFFRDRTWRDPTVLAGRSREFAARTLSFQINIMRLILVPGATYRRLILDIGLCINGASASVTSKTAALRLMRLSWLVVLFFLG